MEYSEDSKTDQRKSKRKDKNYSKSALVQEDNSPSQR